MVVRITVGGTNMPAHGALERCLVATFGSYILMKGEDEEGKTRTYEISCNEDFNSQYDKLRWYIEDVLGLKVRGQTKLE